MRLLNQARSSAAGPARGAVASPWLAGLAVTAVLAGGCGDRDTPPKHTFTSATRVGWVEVAEGLTTAGLLVDGDGSVMTAQWVGPGQVYQVRKWRLSEQEHADLAAKLNAMRASEWKSWDNSVHDGLWLFSLQDGAFGSSIHGSCLSPDHGSSLRPGGFPDFATEFHRFLMDSVVAPGLAVPPQTATDDSPEIQALKGLR